MVGYFGPRELARVNLNLQSARNDGVPPNIKGISKVPKTIDFTPTSRVSPKYCSTQNNGLHPNIKGKLAIMLDTFEDQVPCFHLLSPDLPPPFSQVCRDALSPKWLGQEGSFRVGLQISLDIPECVYVRNISLYTHIYICIRLCVCTYCLSLSL